MIEIMGVPGAGKTSLANQLSVRENIPLLCEPVQENPYLEDYYRDLPAHAFQMQTFLLTSMFQHTIRGEKYKQCVMDASMRVNDIFVEVQHNSGVMNHRDYKTYVALSNTMKSKVKAPDLVVYLQCSPEVAVERIRRRGRQSELAVPFEYWCELNDAYEYWYEEYMGKKLCINVDEIDFVNNYEHEDLVIDDIMDFLEEGVL